MGSDQSIETEARDRINLTLPGQQSFLVSEVAKASKGPVILVIMSGGGMDVSFAVNDPKVTSILWVGFPGEAGGAALADIIFGYYNPCKYIYPFPISLPSRNLDLQPFSVVLCRRKVTYDLVPTIICRQGSDD